MKPEILVSTKTINHQEWLEYRRQGIGGSDASTIVGLNPYNSRFGLYANKKGLLEEIPDNEAMRQGRDFEEYVAKRFEEATGKKVRRRNYMFRSAEYPFMLADIDRDIIGENAGLECKTTSAFSKSDFENGEIPLTYYVQMMHYMSVMDYDRMYLAVVVLGKGFYHFVIERDNDEIESLITAERDFWENNILQDIPPELDGSEATANAIKKIYPVETENDEVCITEELMKRYTELKEISDNAKYQLDSIKTEIQKMLGNCGIGKSDGYKITWKSQQRTTVDSKKLKNKYPEAYAECSATSTSRVLRIIKNKGDK